VVAAGYLRDTDTALALGIPLVGAAANSIFASGVAPWQDFTKKPTLFDTANGLPFEQIAALHPDLILASDDFSLASDDATLAKIAPTLSYLNGPGADPWPVMTTRIGRVLGKSSQASALVKSVQTKIAAAKAANQVLAGKTFTFGPVGGPSSIFTINSAADPSAQFFSQLGMKLSPSVTSLPSSSTPRRAQISLEELQDIDADVVLLAYPDTAVQQQFESQPEFKTLSAVKRGSYVALTEASAVAVAFPSVLSIPYGLGQIVPKVAAAARK
jgi:iron complex transport system substrate-binding protein